jgi:uncharacterized protein YjiS (DUF1127 family)
MTLMSNPQPPARAVECQFQRTFVARSSLAARAVRLVRNSWRVYWDWRARKATILLLQALDARTLRDIGISPSEIESLVHGSGSDRCRRYDATWLWQR